MKKILLVLTALFLLLLVAGPVQAKENSVVGKKYSENNNKLLQWLFYRSNLYNNRIKMAQEEISIKK